MTYIIFTFKYTGVTQAGVEEDYKHSKMIHSTGTNMELDVYIDQLKLAFEYQGEQHYRPIYGMGGDFEQQQIRDAEKQRACKQVLTKHQTISLLYLSPSCTHI